jgi:hypothetical protein
MLVDGGAEITLNNRGRAPAGRGSCSFLYSNFVSVELMLGFQFNRAGQHLEGAGELNGSGQRTLHLFGLPP